MIPERRNGRVGGSGTFDENEKSARSEPGLALMHGFDSTGK
jgi:hypothetical protein